MIRRNFLYLILAITLISVPVFQVVHALTHVIDADTTNLVQVNSDHDQDDTDLDKICLDCLALTAFSVISSILAAFSFNLILRVRLQGLKSGQILHNFFFTYLTRAPPPA